MIDIRQTDDGDVDLTAGDLVLIEPTEQHQRDILIAASGHYKENPVVGVDSFHYLLDNDIPGYLRNVRKQFEKDGMKVSSVKYINGILKTEAHYGKNNR